MFSFASSVETLVVLLLLCSTGLTSLLNIFWAIQQKLFFLPFLKKICQTPKKKNRDELFFGKVIGLQHRNLLKWNFTISVFLGITEIIFWCIFENNYMESWEIIDEFYLRSLVIFLNMAYIFLHSHDKKWKDISSPLHFLSQWFSYAL